MGFKLIVLPGNERLIVLGAILLIWLIARGSQFLTSRKNVHLPPGTARDYGFAGGAICPKCYRPVRLGLMPLKLGFGTKIIRCEYCGKWSIVRRASLEELRAAEAAELADTQPTGFEHEKSDDEKLKDMVDNSRFMDKS